jgi:hypothetical protein
MKGLELPKDIPSGFSPSNCIQDRGGSAKQDLVSDPSSPKLVKGLDLPKDISSGFFSLQLHQR